MNTLCGEDAFLLRVCGTHSMHSLLHVVSVGVACLVAQVFCWLVSALEG